MKPLTAIIDFLKKHYLLLSTFAILNFIVIFFGTTVIGFYNEFWAFFVAISLLEILTVLILQIHADNSEEVIDLVPYIIYEIETKSCTYSKALKKITTKNLLKKNVSFLNLKEAPLSKILSKISHDLDNKNASKFYNEGRIKIDDKYYLLSFKTNYFNVIFVILQEFTETSSKLQNVEKSYQDTLDKELYMSEILDNIPIAVWARNNKSEIVYFNKLYSDLTFSGISRNESENIEIDGKALANAKKALDTNSKIHSERPIIFGGNRYLYEFNDKPSSSGELVISSAWDITEKEMLRNKIKTSAISNKYLLDSISYGCMIVGPDKKLTYFNDALVKLWDMDPVLLNTKPRHDDILNALYSGNVLPAQVNFELFKKERTALIENLREPIEDLFYLPDGQCIRSVAIPYEDNCILFTYEDVTTQLKLQRLNRNLRSIQRYSMDQLQEGVCIFNDSGNLELMNTQMSELWDLKIPNEDEVFTLKEFATHCYKESSEKSKNEMKAFLNHTTFSRIAASHVFQNSSGRVILRSVAPMPDKTLIISDLDITSSNARKEALVMQNNQLNKLDKIKTQFLVNVTKNLKEILDSIRGTYELLLSKNSSNLREDQIKYISQLNNSGDFITKILHESENVIDFSELNELSDIKQFDATKTIKDILKDYKAIFDQNKIKANLISQKSCMINGDEQKFRQAISQHIYNAIIRIGIDGTLNIKIDSSDNQLNIEIKDSGIKIDKNTELLTNAGTIIASTIIDLMDGIVVTKFSEKDKISTTKIRLPIS